MPIARTKHGALEYRLEGSGSKVALLLYGGHTNVNTRLGEGYFLKDGYQILTVSRPGYGNTPLSTGRTPDEFADALAELLDSLHISLVVVVGISAGGRVAMRFTAKYPLRVEKLILQSTISFAPWPDLLTRIGTYVGFNAFTEKYTWNLVRAFIKMNPRAAVKVMLGSLSTLDPETVVSAYTSEQLQELAQAFAQLRSGSGFINDIHTAKGDATDISVPTLIIHSRYDKSVPLEHPRLLARQIPHARLYLSEAESHMLWFSPHYAEIEKVTDEFLRR